MVRLVEVYVNFGGELLISQILRPIGGVENSRKEKA
jgi:hypothetical protein